ncbi:amidohydrolase family protein [Chromobacterium sp.]|uniref:amidohydrolase family protein n=1 Tax=Chromobacterium sp. TaxID=306190 RepID=UPI0035AFE189
MNPMPWLLSAALLSHPAAAELSVTPGTGGQLVIRGRLALPEQELDGRLVLAGDRIVCAGADCAEPADATVLQVNDGLILPGFIDAHNHVAYNALPKWAPPKRYQNRAQWQRAAAYKAFKRPYDQLKRSGLSCEMVKYGEAKALLSGITTIQGSPAGRCLQGLVRNAENPQSGLPVSSAHVRTFILDVGGAPKIDWNATDAFLIHVAEGVDAAALAEFATLKSKGLLTAGTAIIHGTAFGDEEFRQMGAVGSKLIWSPQSNLALYGQTTRVDLALRHGVPVSLGVDWNPTGSDNLFDELRVADRVNREQFAGAIAEQDWLTMITRHPSQALALDSYIGALRAGLKADIVILSGARASVGQTLLNARLRDVAAVLVDGRLLYGDRDAMTAAGRADCDALTVDGAPKLLCMRTPGVPKGGQRLDEVRAALLKVYPGVAPLAAP